MLQRDPRATNRSIFLESNNNDNNDNNTDVCLGARFGAADGWVHERDNCRMYLRLTVDAGRPSEKYIVGLWRLHA